MLGQGRRQRPDVQHVPRPGLSAALVLGLLALVGCGHARQPSPGAAQPSPTVQAAQPAPGGQSAATTVAAKSGVPAFSHVFLIVMENLGYARASRLPYVSALAARYGEATRYDAVAHPSLPNYLALTGGETRVTSDCTTCYVVADNLAAQASAAGVTWGAYMEGLPGSCWLGAWWPPGRYAGKHDPFRYYADVRGSRSLCGDIRPLTALTGALGAGGAAASGSVPHLVWITPNLCHDMHDCSPGVGDAWLSGLVPSILASAAWRDGGVLFITWDEAEGADTTGCCGAAPGGGHVLTLVVAPGVAPGVQVAVPYDHYSLLATVEDGLRLPLLGNAAGAAAMSQFWAGRT